MIHKVRISNFQSHKASELEFVSPGVNVIVGPTDAGKSAIFRAMLWTLFNRPLGDGMRSYWSKKEPTTAEIQFCNGDKLRRIKGASTNEYWIGDTVLKAFGQDPPEDVLALHGLDRQLNVQAQIDPFFLLQSSPGEVATYLNRVARLDDIDKATKALQAQQWRVRHDTSAKEDLKADIESSLEQYADLDQIEAMLKSAEVVADKCHAAQDEHRRLSELLDSIETVGRKIETERRKLAIKPLVERGIETLKAMRSLEDQHSVLSSKIESIERFIDAIDGIKAKIGLRDLIDKALQTAGGIEQMQQRIGILSSAVSRIVHCRSALAERKDRLESMRREWHDLLPEGSVCPLCGGVVQR